MKKTKTVILSVLTLVVAIVSFWVTDRGIYLYNVAAGDMFEKISLTATTLFKPPFSLIYHDGVNGGLLVSLIATLAFITFAFFNTSYKRRDGEEQGSARWGTPSDIKPFLSKNENANIILTKTEGLSLERPKAFEYDRNSNVLIIGGSGSGKTRNFVTPNILQMYGSYVVTDPKGYFWIGQ